jgi:hypothetical protein
VAAHGAAPDDGITGGAVAALRLVGTALRRRILRQGPGAVLSSPLEPLQTGIEIAIPLRNRPSAHLHRLILNVATQAVPFGPEVEEHSGNHYPVECV